MRTDSAGTAKLRRVMMEVGTGKPGYKWVEGYEVTQPNGRALQPYMRKREAKKFCKAQGWSWIVC